MTMKKLITTVAVLGLSLTMSTAIADGNHNWAKSQARLAEKLQLRDTYLPRRFQTANVFDATDPITGASRRYGAAWLVRSKNGISGRIMTQVPTAGDAYTLWVVVFSNPNACEGPCDDPDIGNPRTGPSVFNGTGAISASDGHGGGVVNMDFNVVAGNLANDQFILIGEGDGLRRNRGFKAHVALVVDQHPPIMAGSGVSWIKDLTETNFPGAGPVVSQRAAVFVPCPNMSCPDSVL